MPQKKSPKKTAATKRPAPPRANFTATFAVLKKVLAPVANQLRGLTDDPKNYQLVTKANGWQGGPVYFAGIRMGKGDVSYPPDAGLMRVRR